jgi:hypothetical protein
VGRLTYGFEGRPPAGGDWAGCAHALLAHGMPGATPNPEDPAWVIVAGHRKRVFDEVAEILLAHAAVQ